MVIAYRAHRDGSTLGNDQGMKLNSVELEMIGLIMSTGRRDITFHANQRPMDTQLYDVLKQPIAKLARIQMEQTGLANHCATEAADEVVPENI